MAKRDLDDLVPVEIPSAVLEAIEQHLIELRNFHLGSYKDSYVRRRIAIRIRVTRSATAAEYLELLLGDEEELDQLLKVLNVHVSQFFRNPSTFNKLRDEVVPQLFLLLEVEQRSPLRVWSVGCSAGEEPYSLALVMYHFFPREVSRRRVSIVATDVDPEILLAAEAGIFRRERLIDLPQDMKSRYFVKHGSGYQLVPEIREMVAFRQGDLFQAATFIPSDLILCRNVLIYLEQWQQERIVGRFAEVLHRGGVLVLGGGETLCGEGRNCFEPICPSKRIYRRI